MRIPNLLVVLPLFASVAGCGGGSSPAPTPITTPTPTPTPSNRNPTISQLTVTPTHGIAFLTQFSAQASASDPDGDTVTYEWDLGDGTTATGSSVSNKTYGGNGGTLTVKLTASDGKGGTVSESRAITVITMSGTWRLTFQNFSPLELKLTQSGGTVTGTFTQLEDGPSTPKGTIGQTDPAEPGKIDAAGKFEIRFKVGRFLDFYLRGTLDPSGTSFIGNAFNSGFNGMPFSGTRQ
jgi:hypothetical protein